MSVQQKAGVVLPAACAVAASFDPALARSVGAAQGQTEGDPNIKRSPLCGRNFEYFSEDPYLAGKMAAAYVRGIQKNGIAACPKHFAVNSQELRHVCL